MHACRIDHNLIWNAVFLVVDQNSGNIDLPPNMTSWSSFHNGVSAGLKIAPGLPGGLCLHRRQQSQEP
ncbi:unnamed protein product [Oncorhynchus mykiss]|uniref:Uncharacterized protein n=1 Tax=Oncorhynchus mykiss TaxID=8022 RepID=A0A060WFF5_ONCMY|nr:unnamed protein product [Oncorhynchus mykiss]